MVPPERIVEVPYSIMDGRAALRRLLAAGPDITAVGCTSDVLAIGVVFEALHLGIAIPGALSVTGFDDLELSGQFEPQLTTVRVPAREIGQRTADVLYAAMKRTNKPRYSVSSWQRASSCEVRRVECQGAF